MFTNNLILPKEFLESETHDIELIHYTSNKNVYSKVAFETNMICFLKQGNKTIYTPNGILQMNHHNIALFGLGNKLMIDKVEENNQYESFLLFFSDEALKRRMKNIPTNEKQLKHTNKTFVFKKDNYLKNIEHSLLLINNDRKNRNRLLETKLEEILLYLNETNPIELSAFIDHKLRYNEQEAFKNTIEELGICSLSNNDLAFLCNMSSSSFKRKFNEIFNCSPQQYFIKKRMTQASLWLSQGRRPTSFYYDLGYETIAAFSNEFKKRMGISPREYTKNLNL